jgi:hypothetical protein
VAIVIVFSVLAALLAGKDRFWSGRGLVLLLLGAATLFGSGVLTSTNSGEYGFRMPSFWMLVLAAQLAAVYPQAREKTALAALALIGISGALSQIYTDTYSMSILFHYRLGRLWDSGAVIPGPGLSGLRFFDSPVVSGDNGRLYVAYVTDGLRLLDSHSSPRETVGTVGYQNPFTYLERRRPARGGSTWLWWENNLSQAYLPPAARIFGDAELIMEPHYPSSHSESDRQIEEAYQGYLAEHYSFVARTASWSLYRRKK